MRRLKNERQEIIKKFDENWNINIDDFEKTLLVKEIMEWRELEILKILDELKEFELFEGNNKGIFVRKSELKQKIKGEGK